MFTNTPFMLREQKFSKLQFEIKKSKRYLGNINDIIIIYIYLIYGFINI